MGLVHLQAFGGGERLLRLVLPAGTAIALVALVFMIDLSGMSSRYCVESFGRSFCLGAPKVNDRRDIIVWDEAQFASREKIYSERKQRVKDVCANVEHPRGMANQHILHNAEFKITYCIIRKVATTSWGRIFLQLIGKEYPPSQMFKSVYEAKAKNTKSALSKENVRFTFVRHPFERVVSAYVDKFELAYKDNYIYQTFTPKIYEAVGLPYTKNSSPRPTFVQFVDFLLSEDKKKQNLNEHWVQQWKTCELCNIDYDVIGFLETLEEDSQYILHKSGLANSTKYEFSHLPQHNRSDKGKHGRPRMFDSSVEYFSTLTKEKSWQLYQMYKEDFEMFGYSPDKFLDKAKVESQSKEQD